MPNSIWPTNFSSGRLSPGHSSEENFVSCAFSRERSLLSCTWGRLLWWCEFFAKPFYHAFVPAHFTIAVKDCTASACIDQTSKSEETPAISHLIGRCRPRWTTL